MQRNLWNGVENTCQKQKVGQISFSFSNMDQNLKYQFGEGINWTWQNEDLGAISKFGNLLMPRASSSQGHSLKSGDVGNTVDEGRNGNQGENCSQIISSKHLLLFPSSIVQQILQDPLCVSGILLDTGDSKMTIGKFLLLQSLENFKY